MDYNLDFPELNKYQVVTEHSEYFYSWKDAFEYYNSLDEPAQLWCIDGEPKFLKEKGQKQSQMYG